MTRGEESQCQIQMAKPVGIANIGSTCYMNTAIQCLVHVPAFVECIQKLGENCENHKDKSPSLMTDFAEVVTILMGDHAGNSKILRLRPQKFAVTLAEKLKPMGMHVFEQNDIHEFVVCLMDLLNRSVSYRVPDELMARVERTLAYATGKENILYRFYLRCERAWYQSHLNEWSMLVEYCYGQNVLQTKCETCGELSHIHEPCLGLTLALKKETDRWSNNTPNVLDSMIHDYMGKERIEGYTCDSAHCQGQSRVGNRVVKMSRKPHVFMLFLKRFGADGTKVDASVSVQELLSVGRYCLNPEDNAAYRLVSIGCHTGSSPHGGHYFALCKKGDKWFKIDDDDVIAINSFKDVSSRLYYMLVYERIV